jgi:peptide/nickel transport system substrate-binding protein
MNLQSVVFVAAVAVVAGCGRERPELGSQVRPVPRERTLIMPAPDGGGGCIRDYNSFNPFRPSVSRTGYNYLYEPLYFYAAHRPGQGLIPWIATNHVYSADFKRLTVDLRPGVTWSDGKSWTAHDVVFTINMLKSHAPELTFSSDMKTWLSEAVAENDLRLRIELTRPNPHFLFTYFANNFDNGVPIVPRHIWEGQDPGSFANLDIARGWPVVSGPYRMVYSHFQKRIWDRRDDWWAARIGFQRLPRVERIIYLGDMEEGKCVQHMITDEMDICNDLRPSNIRTAMIHNPRVTTWTGRKEPFGYVDWWPTCMGFNATEPPFDDRRMRWAVDLVLDRQAILQIGWQGCGTTTHFPLPSFPALNSYTDRIGGLTERYPVDRVDGKASAALMTEMGYARDADGYWAKDGKRLRIVLEVFELFKDIAPVIVSQLRRAGFDATFRMSSDAFTRIAQGQAQCYLFGSCGSVRDPFFTLDSFHSRHVKPTGTHTYPFWRWANPEFDAAVDRMGTVPSGDEDMHKAFAEAMEIWLRELPAIPLLQWYHRIPHNETYWRNWPSEENPYVNSAFWARTWLLVLLELDPVVPRR